MLISVTRDAYKCHRHLHVGLCLRTMSRTHVLGVLTSGSLGLAFTMSKSLKVTSSASVFRTPMVPHRVGLVRRRGKEPSLYQRRD